MTDEQIDAMDAGPEMDAAIAAACGIEHAASTEIGLCRLKPEGRTVETEWQPWRPSIDWNDAMFAAEKCRLLEVYALERIPLRTPLYVVADIQLMDGEDEWVARAESGPLAICQAILRLRHKGLNLRHGVRCCSWQ